MWLSEHFHLREAACHDGTPLPEHLIPNAQCLAVRVLEPIRSAWMGPLHVVSWYRTPKYNQRVGGAEGSTHMTADGVDIRPTDWYLAEVMDEFRYKLSSLYRRGKLPDLGGIGLYKGWCHVDTFKAAHGRLRVWRGRGIGSEQVRL